MYHGSLLKRYFTNNIVSLIDIMYQRGFGKYYSRKEYFLCKTSLKERIIFFAKLVVKQLPIFHHPYLAGISSFSKHPFWKPWHNASYMAIQLSISEDSAIQNSFTLQRCTQSTRSRNLPGTTMDCPQHLCEHQINYSWLSTMFKLVCDYPFNWVCSPGTVTFPAMTGDPTVCNRKKN